MHSRMIRGRALIAALACLLASPLAAQTQTQIALTLEQAIREALHNNLQLMAERLELPVADADMIAARLRPNPTITYGLDNLSAARVFGTHPADTTDRTLAAGIPIETAHKRSLRMEAASYSRRIAELQFEDAIRRLRLDVANAFSDAVRAQQRAQLAKSNLELLDDVVQLNDVRVRAGAAAPLELTRAQTALYLLRGDVARAEAAEAAAQLRLRNVLGRHDASAAPIELADSEVRVDTGTLESDALAHRPDLLAARLTLEQRDAALRLAIAQSRVDPIAGFSYTRKGAGTIGSSYGVNVTLPLPLFDRNQGDIARARAEKDVAEAQIKALESQVLTEVRTARGQYLASRAIVDQIRTDLLPAAQKARDTAAYVYRTHASSLLEFLDAERAWNETMDSYFDALAAVRTAAFELEAALGGHHEENE